MEINSLSISSDGSYFVVGGGCLKEKTFGFDLFPLQRKKGSSGTPVKSLLHQRLPSTSSLVTIDCIRLINHSTLSNFGNLKGKYILAEKYKSSSSFLKTDFKKSFQLFKECEENGDLDSIHQIGKKN